MNRPFIAIPAGDCAGIGPEIIIKALQNSEVQNTAKCVIIGDSNIFNKALETCQSSLKINLIKEPEEGIYTEKYINLISVDVIDMVDFLPGKISGMCGKAAYDFIEKAISLAMEKKVAAVATTPINKESLKAGKVPFIGHTEIFGALTNTPDPLTLFEVKGLRVFFLSRHVSLRKACDMVTKERIIDYVKRCKKALTQLGITDGTMAVAGLNPHSGEHGLFGNEEIEEVFPAVEELQKEGINVTGPIGADSVFYLALQGRYNSVLSLYHDQGHIATKTYAFERTIAITCGMPILRTSVDHGTAFDIAWKNKASPVSMIEAILLAAKYAQPCIR